MKVFDEKGREHVLLDDFLLSLDCCQVVVERPDVRVDAFYYLLIAAAGGSARVGNPPHLSTIS